MSSEPSIFSILLSTIKKSKRLHTHDHNRYSTNAPQPSQHMVDSAFSNSSNTESRWEYELERVHRHGQQLANNWYQDLEQLTMLMDKVTSPFHNTNRTSLHRAQLFIESYRNDWKNQRNGKYTYQEKIQQASRRFSDHADLKQCAMGICELEKNLFIYRQTMDQQLTSLWNTQQTDQSMDSWKKYLQQYHYEVNQMETKFKTLLESSSPNPDEYICAVCLSIFTDPITLHPCLHTFCKDCIQHVYCACQLSHCNSSCHDATKRPSSIDDDDDADDYSNDDDRRKTYSTKAKNLSLCLSSTYKPRYRSMVPPKTATTPMPPSPSPSPGRHSYLRSSLKRFTISTSSTMNPTANLPPSPPPSTTITITEDGNDDGDSALEITLPPPPPPRSLPTPSPTTNNINAGPVMLQCTCPLSWSVPPAAQCPLCRHPFGPEDCTQAIALDNLIRFYFPRRDKARQRYNARQRQLKRRSFFTSIAQKWLPSSLVSVPLPSRRLPPTVSSTQSPSPPPDPATMPMMIMMM